MPLTGIRYGLQATLLNCHAVQAPPDLASAWDFKLQFSNEVPLLLSIRRAFLTEKNTYQDDCGQTEEFTLPILKRLKHR